MISISVVIPAWNAALYIAEAIESAMSQSVAPAEVIVVNDGSTDNTAECVQSFGSHIRLIPQSNAGCGAARQRGIAAARGEAIALLDADDLMAPRRIELQSAVLVNDPLCGIVLGKQVTFRSEQERRAIGGGAIDLSAVRPGYVPSAAMIRASTFGLVGPFDAALRVGDFLDWITRARSRGISITKMEEIVAYRRLHKSNVSRSAGTRYADLVYKLRKNAGNTK